MSFEKSVFINCPFDDEYKGMLRPILFLIIDMGFEPRIALESFNSGEARIEKIISIIQECKFALHDLSRIKSTKVGEFYRMNMPFELGLDIGCQRFKGDKWSTKKCLILEAERYRYQAALSDLSNSDIAVHNNDPADAVREIRNWLCTQIQIKVPGSTRIFGRFTDFITDHFNELESQGHSKKDIENYPVAPLMDDIKKWTLSNPWHL
ncbi:hypothetical protein GE253_20565 [Niveispirillum sp. SYP-B3756]|uniref:hypothetical protein n=1 Tax=Niveispirillum sp. SYP-B3756 TaxID=2662178 RepID=UPI001290A0BB|nr:hypothetical protein [Niveispirillum sp. SYP-B3756]MQP67726.1 hypothetical protein [Niveispirillum sp. SYP-B3756]